MERFHSHIRHGRLSVWASNLLNLTIEDATYPSYPTSDTFDLMNGSTFDNNATNGTAGLTKPHLVDPSLFIYTATFLIVFCTISLAINIVILSSVCFMRTRVYPTLYISLSLAGADTFSLFFFALGLFLFSLLPRLNIDLDAPCAMLVIEALRMGGIMTTMFHLAALAGNHYLGILLPLRYPVYMTRRNIQYCIVVLWTIPSSLLIFDMFFLEGDWFKNCPFQFLKRSKFRMRFSIPFFTTLAMMIFIYCHIYKLVCKHQTQPLDGKYQRNLRYHGDKGSLSSFSKTQVNEKAIVTTLMILGSSIFGWLPAFTHFAFFCEDCLLRDYWNTGTVKEFVILVIINFLLIGKTATNSYIYAFRMKEIKMALRRMRRRLLMQLFAPEAAGAAVLTGEWSGAALTRTTSRQSTSRSHTVVLRMNSCHGQHLSPNGPALKAGSLRRTRSTTSRHKQSNTSV